MTMAVPTAASSVHVDNVAPTADLDNDGPVDEGSPATITFSGASDPSSADTSAGFRYTFDCDGTDDLAATMPRPTRRTSTTCTFDDNGSFTVYGRIFDKDDGYTQYSTVVTVNNVAPQNVEGGNDQTVNEGSLVSLSGASPTPAAPTPTPSCGTWSPATARPSPTAPARPSASRPPTTAATR